MCQEDRVPKSWHTTVADLASQSARWCMAWIPCATFRNRIHPTLNQVPNSNFMLIDSRKRLHLIHVQPNSTPASVAVGRSDVTDGAGLESLALEEYWFTKTNRPIRPQKNPCRCSFRRSVRYSMKLKEAKDSVDAVVPNLERDLKKNILNKSEHGPKQLSVESTSQVVERIADFLSNEIMNDVMSEFIAWRLASKNSHCLDVISTSVEHLTSNQVCGNDIDFGLSTSLDKLSRLKVESLSCRQMTGGYMNPTFVGSNSSLDQLGDKGCMSVDDLGNSCGTLEAFSARPKAVIQDYNANEKDTVSTKNKLNDQEERKERKHHHDCTHSSASSRKKPVLLFLHGAGNSGQVWSNLMAAMAAAGYECIAPDLLGHGFSSAPNRSSCYTFPNLLEDLLKVFDKFVPQGGSAVILGHGYGCSFACAMSRYRPEQVVQLVLISGGGPSPLAPPDLSPTSPFMLTCLEPLIMCGFKRDVMYPMYGKQLVGCSGEEGCSAIPPAVFRHVAKGHFWLEGDAAYHRKITAPTLLVHGLRDPHVTLVQQCEMERTIPRSFLEILPEAGHWAMLEAPEALSHMILCFIEWWAE